MSTQTIREAFDLRLTTWATARVPALRVAHENAAFSPINGETYLRAFTLPALTQSQTLEGEHRAFQGVFQINIVCPANAGAGGAGNIADELAALFPNNLRLTREGVTVQIVSPVSAAPPLQAPESYIVPVSFQYRSDTV